MKQFFIALSIFALLFAGGCAFFQQAAEDYKIGRDTPLAAGEAAPAEKARVLASTVAAVPYANFSSPLILLAGPYIFAWLRGRRIRKSQPLNPNPITGNLGKQIGAEALVQHFADIVSGLFEVGPNGSALKRGWKLALLTSIGVALAPQAQQVLAEIIPVLQANPPAWLAGLFNGSALALTVAALGAAEKWLSKVEPVPSVLPSPDAPPA